MDRKTLFDFGKFIENRIRNIQASDSFAFAAAIGVGPWLVPLGPAIIFGYALYVSAPAGMADFRLLTAAAVAVGLIVAGAVSSHNAIASGETRAWGMVVAYIGLEIAGLWLMSVTFDIKIVGTVASLLTLIVYLSRSTAKVIETGRAVSAETERLKLEYQMEQARLQADHNRAMAARDVELKHAEELARIEAEAQASVPQPSQGVSQAVSQAVSYETIKTEIMAELGQPKPNMTQLARQLGVGRSTLYRHLGQMTESGEVKKNGNGYEVIT